MLNADACYRGHLTRGEYRESASRLGQDQECDSVYNSHNSDMEAAEQPQNPLSHLLATGRNFKVVVDCALPVPKGVNAQINSKNLLKLAGSCFNADIGLNLR